jgi:hypothetical protein
MKKVWKFKTYMTEDENRKLMTLMTEEDHELMQELDLELSVDVLEEDKITSFIVCNELNLEKLKSVLFKHEIKIETADVTEFFVDENTNIEDLSEELIYNKLGI